MSRYLFGIDQSTQATKVMLFDENGRLCIRRDVQHMQYVPTAGFVEQDAAEIAGNLRIAAARLLEEAPDAAPCIIGVALCNQRETVVAWNRRTGEPVCRALSWQDNRAEAQLGGISEDDAKCICEHTGLPLSAYFSAAKMQWIMENNAAAAALAARGELCLGNMDAWLLFCLTGGTAFATEYANASRTQLFNIRSLCWDADACRVFGIPARALPEVRDSNACFGSTDLFGLLPAHVPVHAMIGDSQGALYGHGCHEPGMVKTTYGTGASVVLHAGSVCPVSRNGLSVSLAGGKDGRVSYILEGNINYAAAVLGWLKKVGVMDGDSAIDRMACAARQDSAVTLIPAFGGLSAPYWVPDARAAISGLSLADGKNELVRAALDSIAFQVTDIVTAMEKDSGKRPVCMHCDGGASRGQYLMQTQADLLGVSLFASAMEEMSCYGAACLAAEKLGLDAFATGHAAGERYLPAENTTDASRRFARWHTALAHMLGGS